MPIDILMPALSPTMTEGNLASWQVKEGDEVSSGDVIAEIETDKATMEVEAVEDGKIGKIIMPAGSTDVKVNELIAVLLEEGEGEKELEEYLNSRGTGGESSGSEADSGGNDETAGSNGQDSAPAGESSDKARNAEAAEAGRIFASPLARRLASQKNIPLEKLTGSGPNNRIIKADILKAESEGVSASDMEVAAGKSAQSSENGTSSAASSAPSPQMSFGRAEEEYKLVPNSPMRKAIAGKLSQSKQEIPHFYLSIECEVDKLLQMRKEMNQNAGDPPRYKLSVNDFIIKAAAMALRDVPGVNASWAEDSIKQYNNIDIAVAVAIDGGLITPILKNADQKPISLISSQVKELAERAGQGKLAPEEYQGGGFSISNLGMYGIKHFNAIINPPQSSILAIGGGEERVVVKNGEITTATKIDVSMSCDHRVVDGALGAEFLAAFKKYVEKPALMFV
jgi:pyruvate dehydrogenase E2 component (dihydrolipoamide acetyltransferase)